MFRTLRIDDGQSQLYNQRDDDDDGDDDDYEAMGCDVVALVPVIGGGRMRC